MKVFTKKVAVTTYEDKPCGYEVHGYCRKATRTRSCRRSSDTPRVYISVRGRDGTMDAEFVVEDCPGVEALYAIIDPAVHPARLRLAIIEEAADDS